LPRSEAALTIMLALLPGSSAGLALGAALLGLPWTVTGVMLAAQPPYYQQQQQALTLAFCEAHGWPDAEAVQQDTAQRLHWVPRQVPRKFGKVLAGEVAACQSVAQQHGIVLDPIWTLAAWELCCKLAGSTPAETAVGSHAGSSSSGSTSTVTLQHQQQQRQQCAGEEAIQQQQEVVVMLHTGGMLGLCGLAQRLPDQF
jgi:1-aminocyclopropane-1-carboxylate deaminase/D-cysteine desulfhydrase-like pyridoxal-dependent ACC family enzyme